MDDSRIVAWVTLDRKLDRKVLPSGGSDAFELTARFVREAELVARLDHPNIVPVYDRGIERGCLWLAMGFIDGTDAAELIGRHPGSLPAGEAVRIVAGAASGLDEAHRVGLLHRDVTPANILIESRAGEPDPVNISDFGAARPIADTAALTEAGSVLATLDYAAPELLAGESFGHRADVYALGCTLFELLTGTAPFPRRSAMDWLFVDCNVDRAPMALEVDKDESVLGDQRWQRAGSSGRMVWATVSASVPSAARISAVGRPACRTFNSTMPPEVSAASRRRSV
ncbi:serine/threonine-protein kinase [Nocardia sp. NBC_01388]|uniref:serine/threonine-protein kinase n=1 Tax=Nocardia sp. NBC_01388 TaxID=2903596 RepID=UPI00324E8332